MSKIGLIVTSIAIFSANWALAESSSSLNATNGQWSARLGLDLSNELTADGYAADSLQEGVFIGFQYNRAFNKTESSIVEYNLGVSYAMGRDYEYPPSVSYSLDGAVVHANLAYRFVKSNIYILGGINYGFISDTPSIGQKVESDGFGAQVGIGFDRLDDIEVELVMQRLPTEGAIKIDTETIQLAINFAL